MFSFHLITGLFITAVLQDWRIAMIEFKNVSKSYGNNVNALSNIDLKIDKGECIAIIGLSCAGNSNLISCINRMHDITEGKLIVDDVEVGKLKGKEIRTFRKRIGMIFQSFNLVTRTSVLQNVLVSFVPDLPVWRKITGIFAKEHKIKA